MNNEQNIVMTNLDKMDSLGSIVRSEALSNSNELGEKIGKHLPRNAGPHIPRENT